MRLQFTPLALCLLMCLFAKSDSTFAFENTINVEASSLVNKTFTAIKNLPPKSKEVNIVVKKPTSDLKVKTGTEEEKIPPMEIEEKIKNEENSYINSFIPETSLVRKKNEASVASEYITKSEKKFFSQGMYYGFAIMVILLNLVSYFLFDEKVFLNYSIALVGITAVFFIGDGHLTTLGLSGLDNPQTLQSTVLFFAIGFSAWFASKYLNLGEFMPKLKWFSFFLMGVAGIITFASWFAESQILTNLSHTILYMVLASYFIAGVLLFSKKNYAKFYVIASFIPLLFAVDFFVLRNFGIEFLFSKAVHLKTAALVEMLVLTYAIVYRMRAIKEESQLRQTELRIFLKRQEVMNRKNAEKLLEDVYLENLIMHYDLDGLEIKLLQYISEGKDNARIARKLKTTEADVEDLTKELYHKLEIGEQIKEDYRMMDNQPDYIYN